MRSAIYTGEVVHRRQEPEHQFRHRLALPLIDLAEIDQVVASHPLWAAERSNVVSFRRRDFLGDPQMSLDRAVRNEVEAQAGTRPRGPISLLAHLRTWGWLFNPIAVYYCYDLTGTRVEHALVHVSNTPWKESHAYVLGEAGSHVVDKAMHVSPFFAMDHAYRITYDDPGAGLHLDIALLQDNSPIFHATQRLRRREISRAALAHVLWHHPLPTMRVSAGIHTQALRLWGKGARFHPHPRKRSKEVADARTTNRTSRSVEDA